MIRWAVEAQALQVGDEVRDCALVYALTLAEDVKLVEEHRYRVISHVQWSGLSSFSWRAGCVHSFQHSSYLVEHLKELGTGLMNGADDCPSALSQRLHEGKDLEAGRTVQTTGMGHKRRQN